MSQFKLVGLAGSTRRPSKSRALVEAIVAEIQRHGEVTPRIFDIGEAGPGLGAAFQRDQLSADAAHILNAVETADALVIAAPVYKGSYPGLFKHLIDFVEPHALAGRPAVIAATGGGQRHALVVEHQLRPLFGFFSALTIPTAVYASDEDFTNGVLINGTVLERVRAAAAEFAQIARLHARPPLDAVA
jgi:FMN reductase